VLFCVNVTLFPVIEQRLIHHQQQQQSASRLHHTGLEFIHGIVVWLCILSIYFIITQLVKAKVLSSLTLTQIPDSITAYRFNIKLTAQNVFKRKVFVSDDHF